MPELVILIGLQASGKTTFFHQRFELTHVHVSKDRFPNARNRDRRQVRDIVEALELPRSVVVDNTNATREARARLIDLARQQGAAVVGYYFESVVEACKTRNDARDGRARIPVVGLYATAKILERPTRAEGFDALHYVRIVEGTFVVEPWVEEELS